MNLFQKKTPRNFNYKSRFDPMETKDNESLESKWEEIRAHSKLKKGGVFTLPKLIIMLIMVLILLYVLKNYQI